MTVQDLKEALEAFIKNELPNLQKMEDYYSGKHNILNKKNRTIDKKDAKLIHDYPGYITTIATAYFLGKPISYTLQDDKLKKDFEKLSEYLSTEEEQQENFEHSENCSIFGKSYELWYKNADNTIGNAVVDPRDCFILRDNTVKKEITAAVRWDKTKNKEDKWVYKLEVYDSTTVTTYEFLSDSDKKEVPNIKGVTKLHGFNQVPIIEFLNNKRAFGDFKKVVSLIDGYDEAASTSIDDMTDFTDALLVLTNVGGTDKETLKKIKEDKLMLIDDDGDAKWLIKQVNDSYAQNNKNRLNQDIHKFSMIPDMQDKEFSGNSSGVALGYKLLALEQLAAQKEMHFKKAINQRLQLMIDFHNLKIKATDIQKVFTRNVPKNLVEAADTAQKLQGIVSHETILSILPFIEDVKGELEKIKAEEDINAMKDMNTPLGVGADGSKE
ncbi:phage portal protein [Fusobacterium polymorphum]|uniref:phage portal protein n=1 Tax=Fusobacterium nucleatum subsp. polymorphum TaxID=76857 RepID=UPI0030D3CF35